MFFRISNGAGVKPQGTAVADDVLANKTFSNDSGVAIPGTMVNNTGWTGEGTPTGNNQVDVVIPKGYHDGTGKVVCKGQTAYSAGVANGQSAARIGTAGTGDVLAGKTFTNASGSGLSGSMVNRGAWSTDAKANGAVTIPAGYHNGAGKVNVNVHDSYTTTSVISIDNDVAKDSTYDINVDQYVPAGYSALGYASFSFRSDYKSLVECYGGIHKITITNRHTSKNHFYLYFVVVCVKK
jgi:hypothetical protein